MIILYGSLTIYCGQQTHGLDKRLLIRWPLVNDQKHMTTTQAKQNAQRLLKLIHEKIKPEDIATSLFYKDMIEYLNKQVTGEDYWIQELNEEVKNI